MPDIKDAPEPKKTPQKGIDVIARFEPFFANDHHAFVVRKAERLASALHVVTGFIAPEEPLRQRLRRAALDLVEHSVRVERIARESPTSFGTRAAEIAALLDTAQAAGMVSEMNAALVASEYADLAQFVRDRYSIITVSAPDMSAAEPALPAMQTTTVLYKGQKDTPSYRTNKRTNGNGHNGGQRHKDILALFDTHERISIKDAAAAIPGVSEKTIQRELLSMVDKGLLIKEGERRWSTYRKAGS